MGLGLLLSVGGTPEPLARSLREHRPKAVCFFASQDSIELVSEIRKMVAGLTFTDYKVIVDDVNDVTHCYERALSCCDFWAREGIPAQEIVVDFTGGTKAMSAALTLLAVSRSFRLSYIGGTRRNKQGLGTVVTGCEQVFAQINPWEILAIDDRKRAALMFNRFQFEASIDAYDTAIHKTHRPQLKHYLEILRDLTEAYGAWDRFKHREAISLLGRGFSKLKQYAAATGGAEAHSLAGLVQNNVTFLEAMRGESDSFRRPCTHHLLDLLANARRREAEGKYDDGVARLYRSAELLAQLRLRTVHGIEAGGATEDDVPETLRDDFVRKHMDSSSQTLKLPLQACYRLLRELDDELGCEYARREKHVQDLLSSRNNSVLAHGFGPVGHDTFRELWQVLIELGGIDEDQLPGFPRYPIDGP